jgi:hypothetical protein
MCFFFFYIRLWGLQLEQLELEQLELEQLDHQIQLPADKEHNFLGGKVLDADDQGSRRNKHQTVGMDDSLLSCKIHR